MPLDDLKPKDHVVARYLATADGREGALVPRRGCRAAPHAASAPAAGDGAPHAGGN